ncbi:MAG: tRNA 2-thiouridine(34) synthase MnmA, partial [Verrucomicrobiae bacterium]|nr:tRNA 2-thiouridine(34) synthase MnmA [Verrucomicrobiae bacterium]
PGNDYGAFLKSHGSGDRPGENAFLPGEIVHRDGRVLGRHEGIEFFTVGQRKGLGVSHATPLYVLDIDPESRRVVVGDDDDLWCESFVAERVVGSTLVESRELEVKIRHSHRGALARVTPLDGYRARVDWLEPQRAVTPGQAAVFYQGDAVVGGGWIARSAKPAGAAV